MKELYKHLKKIDEHVYNYTLDNGLRLTIVEKKGFTNSFAALQVNFGSKYHNVTIDNEDYEIPLGTAHFIEHILFSSKDGSDINEEFAKLELDTNAYTSFDETVYHFQGFKNIKQGIKLLFDFVLNPTINEIDVEEERDIIIHELLMYKDSLDNNLYYGIIENLYSLYPLRYDVGGTEFTVSNITKEQLEFYHKKFYVPSNMNFVFVGDCEARNIASFVEDILKSVPKVNLNVKLNNNPFGPVVRSKDMTMDIVKSKLAIGYKFNLSEYFNQNSDLFIKDFNLNKAYYSIKFILRLLISSNTKFYQKLLDDKITTRSFTSSLYLSNETGYLLIECITDKQDIFIKRLKRRIKNYRKIDVNEEEMLRFKKRVYGDLIQSTVSVDSLASAILGDIVVNYDFFDRFDVLSNLTLEEVKRYITLLDKTEISVFSIYPKKN